MPLPLQVVLATLPCLLWLVLVVRHDRGSPEPWWSLALVFGLGALGVTPIVLWRAGYELWLLPEQPGPWQDVIDSLVVTAIPEEVVKGLAIAVGALLWRVFDERLDGIVYGAAAGLGFAAAENLWFLSFSGETGVVFVRMFTANLMHLATSALVGYALGLAKLGSGHERWLPVVGGIAIAILLHGFYDLFLIGGGRARYVAVLVVLPAALVLVSLGIRRSRSRSSARL